MDDYGVEPQLIEEQQASAQLVEKFAVAKDGTTDLDDGELLGRNRGKKLKILLNCCW